MAIFERLSDLLRSNVNDLIDKAENPEKMVKQIIIDMEQEIKEATQALGQAMASEKQAFNQVEKSKKTSLDWENKAKMALTAGNQELAKKALANKVSVDVNLVTFESSYNQISSQTTELKGRVEVLRNKLEEARTRQNMIIARSKMADAQKKVATAISGTDSSSAFSKLDKMERKVEGKEADAEAFAAMSGDTTFANDEFKDLATDTAVDSELARLMAEMGK